MTPFLFPFYITLQAERKEKEIWSINQLVYPTITVLQYTCSDCILEPEAEQKCAVN